MKYIFIFLTKDVSKYIQIWKLDYPQEIYEEKLDRETCKKTTHQKANQETTH
jgi:hypothetical protein